MVEAKSIRITLCFAALAILVCVPGCPARSPAPGSVETVLLPGNVPLDMVWIPAGTFMMGAQPDESDARPDEWPRHEVTLSHGFWLAKYELTKAQWTAVTGEEVPWLGGACVLDHPDSPAVYVRWTDAVAYIAELNTVTGKTFRLPTEAEWEYACRAGTTTRFYWGHDAEFATIDDYAWWSDNTLYIGQDYAHVVGQKLPNPLGLYDMAGNVAEWCADWHGGYPSAPVTDPAGPGSGTGRVYRGGGYSHLGRWCSPHRSSARNADDPWCISSEALGFRLAM